VGQGEYVTVTYDKVHQMAAKVWDNGGRPEALFVSPAGKAELMASMLPSETFSVSFRDGFYFLPTMFGELKVYVDKFMPKDTVYVLSEADAARLAIESNLIISEMLGLHAAN
jgi:hypothetical protein